MDDSLRSDRPLGGNPFPREHPGYVAFEDASVKAEAEIAKLELQLLCRHSTSAQEMLDLQVECCAGKLNICANKALVLVGDLPTARLYVRWLADYAQSWLKDRMGLSEKRWLGALERRIPYFRPEDLEPKLRIELMRVTRHYKALALDLAQEFERREQVSGEPEAPHTLAETDGDIATTLTPNLSAFDHLAGRLMLEARPLRSSNGRLPHAEYSRIAATLDEAGFKPLDHLEGTFRSELARWNRKYSLRAIHTFEGALRSSWLRRGVQKRLNRAESKLVEIVRPPNAGQVSTDPSTPA